MKTAEELLSPIPEAIYYCGNCCDIWSDAPTKLNNNKDTDNYCLNCHSDAYVEIWNLKKSIP